MGRKNETTASLPRSILLAMGQRWRENDGNLLVAVTGLILLAGGLVIAGRQAGLLRGKSANRYVAADAMPADDPQTISGDGSQPQQVITVRIFGAASDQGSMKVAAYASPEGFNDPERAVANDSWIIRNGLSEGKLGLPPEINQVAIAAYHDANSNGVLDRNPLGVPTERYGFTGNARGLTGPPEFDQVVVPLTADPIDISIR